MNNLPIIAINCAADQQRRDRVLASMPNTDIHWIDAVDARLGAQVFKEYLHLLPDQFWLSDEIKPGAFACFISHRLAWQFLIDQGWDQAIIIEDDSDFVAQDCAGTSDCDLRFLNDRAVDWVPSGILENILSPPPNPPRAIGGDGYQLTSQGAKALLVQSSIDKICCGVDWYLVYAGLDTQSLKHRDVKAVPEIKKLWKQLGPRAPILRAEVAPKACLNNRTDTDSSIIHSNRVNINLFRQDIEKY